MLVISGGAGTGKTETIKVLAELTERKLQKPGDNPEKPKVVVCAPTGTAAANIDGMTLHSAFNLGFGNRFLSLGDKSRDQKRTLFENLRVLIVDEFSMVKADFLYILHLRLQELLQNDLTFGGIMVIFVGDPMQLPPVMAKWIFDQPLNPDFQIAHLTNPLWPKFQPIILSQNHRQDQDSEFGDLLGRMRIDDKTNWDADLRLLGSKVVPENYDFPRDAVFVSSLNKDVNEINKRKLEELSTPLHSIEANVRSLGQRMRVPKITNDGSIKDTPLQKVLELKVGAEVVHTYNTDTSDGLVNGAFGKVVGFRYNSSGKVKQVLVQFYDEKVGRNLRKKNSPDIAREFPDIPVTPIEMMEMNFGLSKKQSSNKNLMAASQFPLRLAWAVTAHRMQGFTVKIPKHLIADLRTVKFAAQAYVMLSRVQSLDQLLIVEHVPEDKIYACPEALQEYQRLQENALNHVQKLIADNSIVVSLNIRSLPRHHADLIHDKQLLGKTIALQEVWTSQLESLDALELPGYQLHVVAPDHRARGVAFYFNAEEFHVSGDICTDDFQISCLSGVSYDIVNVYRSSADGNVSLFLDSLEKVIKFDKDVYVVGDFNIDLLKFSNHMILEFFQKRGFQQWMQGPTHTGGGLLDHVYIKSEINTKVDSYFPYFSDHVAILVSADQTAI